MSQFLPFGACNVDNYVDFNEEENDNTKFSNTPSINIFLFYPTNCLNNSPNYNYFQYPMYSSIYPNSYYTNNTTFQNQLIQQPQSTFCNFPNIYSMQTVTSANKSESHHKKKKTNKKSKSSKKSSHKKKESKELKKIDCENGIFHYLFDKYKTNPISLGIIGIEGNSYNPSWEDELPSIIDPAFKDYWLPKDSANSYFKIDFKSFLVKINRYHIRVGNGHGSYLFKSWVLTGFTKDNKEIELDKVDNCLEISSTHAETTRIIQNDKYVQSIKLTIKGTNERGDFLIDVGAIELYGSLKSKKE